MPCRFYVSEVITRRDSVEFPITMEGNFGVDSGAIGLRNKFVALSRYIDTIFILGLEYTRLAWTRRTHGKINVPCDFRCAIDP